MNNELINQLSKLKIEKSAVKRNLDRNYYNVNLRKKLFSELKFIDNEINKIKFKLRMEKIKNANNNTNITKN